MLNDSYAIIRYVICFRIADNIGAPKTQQDQK